jgi:hypothetical protein
MRVFTMAGCLGDARGTMRNARGGTNDLCQREKRFVETDAENLVRKKRGK